MFWEIQKWAFKGDTNVGIGTGKDVDIDIDSDMAVSVNWVLFPGGFRAP